MPTAENRPRDPTHDLSPDHAAVSIDLNAAEGSLDHLEAKAADAGATWEIRSEDF
jgi:hypothetical protein